MHVGLLQNRPFVSKLKLTVKILCRFDEPYIRALPNLQVAGCNGHKVSGLFKDGMHYWC
jgi:hypothetical protein